MPVRLDHADLPPGTDWAWRPAILTESLPETGPATPESGSGFAAGITVWHDLPGTPITLMQVAPDGGADGPPHALDLICTAGPGTGYCAISLDLPEGVLAGLDTGFVLQVDIRLGADSPPDLYLRLNIEHGPNTERLLRHLDLAGGRAARVEAGFDLGFVEMNPRRLSKIWLDLIAERPGRNRIRLHDLVVSRHRRADM